MRPGNIEQFADLSQFTSLAEFNHHTRKFLAIHKTDFTKSEYLAFQRLVRFCAKYHGVANAKIASVVSACTENGGVSRSSFERMLRKAKKLSIVKVHHTIRAKGGYAHNVFVFQRFDAAKPEKLTERKKPEQPCPHRQETANSEPETEPFSKTQTQDKNNKRTDNDLDHTYTSDTVPTPFRNLVKCFFDSAETIEKYYSRVLIAAYENAYEKEEDKVLDIAINSFKQLIGKMEKGGVRNPFAYFYSICHQKFDDLYISELTKMCSNSPVPEGHWLTW